MGRSRVKFAILLLMFEEYGKLLNLLREIERSAKSDYENVRMENYQNHCLNGKNGAVSIFDEVQEVEKAAQMLSRSRHLKDGDTSWIKRDFCELKEAVLYRSPEPSEGSLSLIPSDEQMDIYVGAVERHALSAADYLHELAKALGLWRESGIAAHREKGAPPHSIRYGTQQQTRL